MEIITTLVAIIGGLGGASGIIALFTLRQKKDSFAIDNLTKIIDEVRKNHDLFKKESQEKIKGLESRLNQLALKDTLQTQSISRGYRCKYLYESKDKDARCPIITDFSVSLKTIDKLSNSPKDATK